MLVDLPQALSKSILNYLSVHSSDRLSVATSCRGLLNDVEAFSKNELHRITEEHAVDDDWLFRVGMQAAASAAMNADGQPWSMPSLVSQRRMLRSAYQTHLYSLGTDPLQRRGSVDCLALHPDGKKLLSCDEDDNHLDLWDLQTRQRIRSFRGDGRYCAFRSGRVVSQSHAREPGIIQVWRLDGSFEVSHEFEQFVCTDLETSSGDEVMWIDEQNVNAFNLFTGTTRHVRHGLNLSDICTQQRKPFFCKDRLLVWIEYNNQFDNGNGVNYGIYVMDRSTLQELSRIEGRFHSFAFSRDGDVVTRTEEGEYFDVFHLEGDHLVFDRSLAIDESLSLRSMVLLWNSKLFVSVAGDSDKSRRRIDVYNTVTGDIERKLHYPRSNCIASDTYMTPVETRKEVLYGFCTLSGFHTDPHIRAYLLED